MAEEPASGGIAALQINSEDERAGSSAVSPGQERSPAYKEKVPAGLQLVESGDESEEDDGRGRPSSSSDVSESGSTATSWSISSARLMPPSPLRGETLHGGLPTATRKTPRSSLTPYTQSTGGEAVVSVAKVTAELERKGLMLDLSHIHHSPGDVLGKGAMGILYNCKYSGAGAERQVAVKHMLTTGGFCESELTNAALHEMVIGSKVAAHPNIIAFVGAAVHPVQGILLVYELIDGINMEDFFHFQVWVDVGVGADVGVRCLLF